jgi:broad specificity phosphatase PhoE
MKYILIRHAQTDANRSNRALFGHDGAPINKKGAKQANNLHTELLKSGIDLDQPVAASDKIRTQQTASGAGFNSIKVYGFLGEVVTNNVDKTFSLIKKGELPPEAIRAAEKIIASPPKEKIWFTHGLVIAALQIVLNQKSKKFIPDFCEVREIEI